MISVMDRTIELGLKKKTIILGLELCVRFGHRREKSSYKINIKTFFTQRKCHYCWSKTMSSVWDETRYFLGVSSSLYSIEGIPINLSLLLQNSRFLLDEKFFQLQKLKFFYVIFPYINALVYYMLTYLNRAFIREKLSRTKWKKKKTILGSYSNIVANS